MLSKGVRPQNPAQHLRGSSRVAGRWPRPRRLRIIPRQETCRNAVCTLEAYLAARPAAIARAMRRPVRVYVGSDCAEPPQACQIRRPATTVRPFVRCVNVASVSKVERKCPHIQRVTMVGFKKSHRPPAPFGMPISATKLARNGPAGPVRRRPFIGVDRKWPAERQHDAKRRWSTSMACRSIPPSRQVRRDNRPLASKFAS